MIDHHERHDLIAAIAAALSGSWKAVPCQAKADDWPCYHFSLVRADGVSFGLHWEEREKKLTTTCDWPRHGASWYDDRTVSTIGCGITRGAVAIAKDIERRFLPTYVPALLVQREKRAKDEVRELAAVILTQQLAGVLGLTSSRKEAEQAMRERSRGASLGDYARGFDLTVQSYGHVKFEINTSDPDRALRIARFLMTLEPEKEA